MNNQQRPAPKRQAPKISAQAAQNTSSAPRRPVAPPPSPKTQNKAPRPPQNRTSPTAPKSSPANRPSPAPVAANSKRGISPSVILLAFVALVFVILAISMLMPNDTTTDKPNTPSTQQQGNTNPLPNSGDSGSNGNSPSTPTPPPEIEKPQLTVESVTETFDSGSYVIYGYPTIDIQDQPEITEKINTKLKALVESDILPMVEQLRMEDTPGYLTSRLYNFSTSAGSGFYSIVVTIDTNEGITAGRSTFCWNFFADSGEYVSLRENCTDRYRLAVAIDGCIENVTSYDQVIHAWLIDVLTAEFDSEEFSFYFEGENMIAVINNNLRLDSFIRDPILITVPYEKIANIFPYQTKE